jgi:DNA-binding transcriptional LysR family regulator
METDRLRQFCTIIEIGSLSKAAEILGISHSGLSKSISTLEDELGFPLFQPQGRGLVPTDRGREIYKSAQEILNKVQALHLGANPNERTSLRIGVLEIFTAHFIGSLARDSFPDLPFDILELAPGQIEASIIERRIDMGLTYVPLPQEGIEYLKICPMKLGVFARREAFSHTPLHEIPFVTPISPIPLNPLGIKESDGWPESLFPRKKTFAANLLSTGLDLARAGVCAIFIPSFLAAIHNEVTDPAFHLRRIQLPSNFPNLNRAAFLVKRTDAIEDKRMKKLSTAVRNLIRRSEV